VSQREVLRNAYAQRQCCDRNRSKGWIPHKKTQGATAILSKIFDPACPTGIATVFLDLVHPAELLARLSEEEARRKLLRRKEQDAHLDKERHFHIEQAVADLTRSGSS
jgi:hypothetical protein